MLWKDVILDISETQRTRLKELGAKFTEMLENPELPTENVLEPLKTELSKIINANSDVKAVLKDAIENGNHYVLRLIDTGDQF